MAKLLEMEQLYAAEANPFNYRKEMPAKKKK